MNSSMTPRERISLALNHEEPDRVPIDLGSSITGITLAAYGRLAKYLGIQKEVEIAVKPLQTVRIPEEVLEVFEIDTRYLNPRSRECTAIKEVSDGRYVDEWGVERKLSVNGYYYDIVDCPFKKGTIEEIKSYDWPDPNDPHLFKGLKKEAEDLYKNSSYAIIGDPLTPALFEPAWYLRGFDKFLIDLLANRDFAEALLDSLLDYQLAFFNNFLNEVGGFIQVLMLGDDLGTQSGLLISPSVYREIIKPRHTELFTFIKKKTKAKVFLHCCGSIAPLIDDLLDAGVDILHPAQPLAANMDSESLKKRFGHRVCFWGGIDIQKALPGTIKEVRKEVRRRIAAFAPGGGYVLAPGHNIQPDVPPENICELYKTGKEIGGYPKIK